MCGVDLPILRNVAIKILSQPCSASACERNWSAFDAAHTKKRNRLQPQKLQDMVYVRMNLYMQKTSSIKESKDCDPINLDSIIPFPELEEGYHDGHEEEGGTDIEVEGEDDAEAMEPEMNEFDLEFDE